MRRGAARGHLLGLRTCRSAFRLFAGGRSQSCGGTPPRPFGPLPAAGPFGLRGHSPLAAHVSAGVVGLSGRVRGARGGLGDDARGAQRAVLGRGETVAEAECRRRDSDEQTTSMTVRVVRPRPRAVRRQRRGPSASASCFTGANAEVVSAPDHAVEGARSATSGDTVGASMGPSPSPNRAYVEDDRWSPRPAVVPVRQPPRPRRPPRAAARTQSPTPADHPRCAAGTRPCAARRTGPARSPPCSPRARCPAWPARSA